MSVKRSIDNMLNIEEYYRVQQYEKRIITLWDDVQQDQFRVQLYSCV